MVNTDKTNNSIPVFTDFVAIPETNPLQIDIRHCLKYMIYYVAWINTEIQHVEPYWLMWISLTQYGFWEK